MSPVGKSYLVVDCSDVQSELGISQIIQLIFRSIAHNLRYPGCCRITTLQCPRKEVKRHHQKQYIYDQIQYVNVFNPPNLSRQPYHVTTLHVINSWQSCTLPV